ncbi:MAG: S46 family peptidase [Thermoanaerobaculia bacterium]|nr:S46 family peptidase [Thermoanaerobaculia bacterium]
MRLERPLLTCLAALLLTAPASAREGMWTPEQLPDIAPALKDAGLEVPPSTLADVTQHPMSAVISLGGCTASFVSADGLAVTNHHCAYGALQLNSTEERNLIQDGFIAHERSEEIAAGPGSRILVTVAFDDVTSRMTEGLEELDGKARYDAREDRRKAIVAECEEDEGHRCRVASYHGGHHYRLTKQLEIRDVRIVYAPKGSVGRYGGDVDNWQWPRHTGDFAFYRAYVSPDGEPADPAEENVPYRPTSYLEVAPDGVQSGDFVMVLGYPGFTSRHRLAAEIEHTFGWSYPYGVEQMTETLGIIDEATADDPEAAIKYASMVGGINNGLKNRKGMLEGYSKGNMLERKKALESELAAWIEADPDRKARWGDALKELRDLLSEAHADDLRDSLQFGALGSTLYRTASRLHRLAKEQEKPDAERKSGYQERDMRFFRARLERQDRRFDPDVDRALWKDGILEYFTAEPSVRIDVIDSLFGVDPSAGTSTEDESKSLESQVDSALERFYSGTRLDDGEVRLALIDATTEDIESSDDPFLAAVVALYDETMRREVAAEELSGKISSRRPKYMEALLSYLDSLGRSVYPDANSTLRVTFGNVQGYSPRDGSSHLPFTTLQGLLQKDTGEAPFDAPAEVLEAVRDERHGQYGVQGLLHGEKETVPVNFLADLDITGGNSGSAVLDGKGRLVGLAFDGNWESIISDWDFLPQVSRSINVDVRYMLWMMDEIDQVDFLLREMGVEPAP